MSVLPSQKLRSCGTLLHMGLTFTNQKLKSFFFTSPVCAIAELMASRNKVARRKGKGGAGDEVRYVSGQFHLS